MAYKPDYSKDLYKQVQDMITKSDNLSSEIKTQKIYFEDKIEKLETENKNLKLENQRLKDDNDRLKKIINNNSNNSSNPPLTDIKKNIPNNREKTNRKR